VAMEQRQKGREWFNINWDAWKSAEGTDGNKIGRSDTDFGLHLDEGIAALEKIVKLECACQVAVSTYDIEERLDRWIRMTHSKKMQTPEGSGSVPLNPRPSLSSVYVGPGNETEQIIAE